MQAICTHAQILINEYSAANLSTLRDNFAQYEDWIELYNAGSVSVDMSGYFISDDPATPRKWKFPVGYTIPSKAVRLVWASGRDTALKSATTWHVHTNFKITQTKKTPETLVLSDAGGVQLDEVKIGKTRLEQSRGRQADGGPVWVIFKKPTPRLKNAGAFFISNAEKPNFDKKAGFYSSPQTLRISTTQSNTRIFYTLDGSEPSDTSALYTAPIQIPKTTVVKAITVSNDAAIQKSLIEFATFFINEPRNNLRVMSITGDSLLTLAEGNRHIVDFGSFEYFDLTGTRTASAYGEFNSHGQDSWVNDQRSIDIICRDECGYNNALKEKIFDISERDEFQRIILRAAGDDNYPDGSETPGGGAHVRDAFLQNLVKKGGMHLDVRTGEKAIIFLNGQYWGLYDLRERPDDHDYTEHYYGQDKFHIQYIQTWDRTWAEYGGNKALRAWEALHEYIMNNNMADQKQFDIVAEQLDVKSLTDYVITNSVSVCSDWLNYNTGWWRGMDPNGQHRKWGYTLWDNDATFGYYVNYTGIPDTSATALPCDVEVLKDSVLFNIPTVIAEDTFIINGVVYLPGDTIQRAANFNTWVDLNGHMNILAKLMQNEGFRQYYVTRYADLLNTVFSKENMLTELDAIYNQIRPEIPRHIQRWGGTLEEWEANVARLRDFIDRRTTALRTGMRGCYNLQGPYPVTFNIAPVGSGSMYVNTRYITQFPFTDWYYGGIATKVAVQPAAQYELANWKTSFNSSIQDAVAATTQVFVAGSDTVTARLRKIAVSVKNLEDQGEQLALKIFPTLVTDAFTLEYRLDATGDVDIRLLSAQGIPVANLLRTTQQAGQYAVNAQTASSHLPTGMYFVEFRTDKARTLRKIFVQQR
jgi:hypothetical protein